MSIRISPLFKIALFVLCTLLGGGLIHSQSEESMISRIGKTDLESLSPLLEEGDVILDEELTLKARELQPRINPTIFKNKHSGELYLQPGLSFDILVFQSSEDLTEFLQSIVRKPSGRKHTFHDFISDTTSYFRYSADNERVIVEELGLRIEDLDRSIASVKLIQTALGEKPRNFEFLGEKKDLFYAVANYIGDIIYNRQGKWAYRVDRDGKTVLPSLIPLQGRSSYNWFRDCSRAFLSRSFGNLENIIYTSLD